MKNITIISFIFILLGYLSIIPVSSAQNSLIKAKKRCNSISQRPSSGLDQIDQIIQGNSNLINMTDGLRDTCEVLQTIENEISARSLPRDIMKLKYARKEVVNLIVTKNTPSLFDAEYYCDTRPLTKKFTKKNKNFKKTVNSLKKSCALLQQAKKLIKKQGIISPRPVEYFSNLAALRITIDAIIIGEKGWRKYEE